MKKEDLLTKVIEMTIGGAGSTIINVVLSEALGIPEQFIGRVLIIGFISGAIITAIIQGKK